MTPSFLVIHTTNLEFTAESTVSLIPLFNRYSPDDYFQIHPKCIHFAPSAGQHPWDLFPILPLLSLLVSSQFSPLGPKEAF